nr:hypothetical protein [Moraxella sp.]
MQLDNLDYRIITEALYHLATNDSLEIGDKAVAELTDDELENRLLCLREKIARLESKSRGEDYYF